MAKVIGTVRKLVKDYGFISGDDDGDYFFHDEDRSEDEDFGLARGDRVEFVCDTTPKGPRARRVTWISPIDASSTPIHKEAYMATDPDTGIREGDQAGRVPPGKDQNDYTHSESGNSGGSKQTSGGPGTAGSTAEQSTPGAPQPPR